MERFSAKGQVHRESISDAALERLRGKFDEAISHETALERATALETIITDCAVPLEALDSGAELSPEYSGFLQALTKMHMLESAHARLERIFQPV